MTASQVWIACVETIAQWLSSQVWLVCAEAESLSDSQSGTLHTYRLFLCFHDALCQRSWSYHPCVFSKMASLTFLPSWMTLSPNTELSRLGSSSLLVVPLFKSQTLILLCGTIYLEFSFCQSKVLHFTNNLPCLTQNPPFPHLTFPPIGHFFGYDLDWPDFSRVTTQKT